MIIQWLLKSFELRFIKLKVRFRTIQYVGLVEWGSSYNIPLPITKKVSLPGICFCPRESLSFLRSQNPESKKVLQPILSSTHSGFMVDSTNFFPRHDSKSLLTLLCFSVYKVTTEEFVVRAKKKRNHPFCHKF